MREEIYDYLVNLNKLDKKKYDFLVVKHGAFLVDSVIEQLIDEDLNNAEKFEYYISKLESSVDSVSSFSAADFYFKDLCSVSMLSPDENCNYANEAYRIVNELNSILDNYDYDNLGDVVVGTLCIDDKIEFVLKNSDDSLLLTRIRMLYKEFIEIRNKLVTGNLKLVIAIAKKFYNKDIPISDVIQYGNMGLMKAVEKYNPNFNVLFSTYSYYWIRQSINRYTKADLSFNSSISYRLLELNGARIKAVNFLTNKLGRNPTTAEICEYMNIEPSRFNEIEMAFNGVISVDSGLKDDDGAGRFIDMISDDSVNIEETVCNRELYSVLIDLMDRCLNERQIFILTKRFGLDGEGMTLEEVGQLLGLTRERIRQIETKALIKLKNYGSKKLSSFRG